MNGVLIVDKPEGVTSHDVVRRVRRLAATRRVGHAGTLDPMASGILPVAIGEGTRLVEFLMDGDKSYRTTLKLGEITDTQDAEGTVLERRAVGDLSVSEIAAVCASFTGDIDQIPPMYSALKRDGVPLYRLARQGVEVERQARRVRIARIEVIEVALPLVTLEVDCSKGTYIRTLGHDIGLALGFGAHLCALRRTRCGAFGEQDSLPLDRLEHDGIAGSSAFLSLEEALRNVPVAQLTAPAASRLLDGVSPDESGLSAPPVWSEGALVALHYDGTLRAVTRYVPSRLEQGRSPFELLRVFTRGHRFD
ncbi:MAG TPA: tRNA pseudouridine(55) synthase TruB [Desulfuromonadales bacterium]|nr:tRNA pseudouridine(55) synthase TruB [Desulfuromonadales bacterium]